MLPNGYCLLPPRQVCGKGNACLTCDKFATDATFLPELTSQLNRTGQLVETRQAAFLARTGTPMGEDNVWLAGLRTEQNALRAIITKLERHPAPSRPAAGPRRRDDRPHRRDHRQAGGPMTQDRPGNTANLKAAAARRHQAAAQRAEAGLDKLIRSGEQVTFRGGRTRLRGLAGVPLQPPSDPVPDRAPPRPAGRRPGHPPRDRPRRARPGQQRHPHPLRRADRPQGPAPRRGHPPAPGAGGRTRRESAAAPAPRPFERRNRRHAARPNPRTARHLTQPALSRTRLQRLLPAKMPKMILKTADKSFGITDTASRSRPWSPGRRPEPKSSGRSCRCCPR